DERTVDAETARQTRRRDVARGRRLRVARDRRVVPQIADRHIAANGAVGRLLTRIERGVTTRTPDEVVRQTGRGRADQRTSGHAADRVAIAAFRADIATDLQAGIRARDIEEPRPIQAANLHVLHQSAAGPSVGLLNL